VIEKMVNFLKSSKEIKHLVIINTSAQNITARSIHLSLRRGLWVRQKSRRPLPDGAVPSRVQLLRCPDCSAVKSTPSPLFSMSFPLHDQRTPVTMSMNFLESFTSMPY
jgi:hypothetical protein